MRTTDWECPFCGLKVELASDRTDESVTTISQDNVHGPCVFRFFATVCPNRDCRSMTAAVSMYTMAEDNRGTLRIQGEPVKTWRVIPASNARGVPDYVPERIAKEYLEACAVLDASPNASATLARRCLQGILRDFFGVKKNTLADELDAIKDKIEPETWEVIDAARKVGMLGKNMEKGVNLILDTTEPNEPKVLISLIEYLIQECYVVRHQRKQRVEALRGRNSLKPPT